jgi:hypothetical protein
MLEEETRELNVSKCDFCVQFKHTDEDWNKIHNDLRFKINVVCKSYFKFKADYNNDN